MGASGSFTDFVRSGITMALVSENLAIHFPLKVVNFGVPCYCIRGVPHDAIIHRQTQTNGTLYETFPFTVYHVPLFSSRRAQPDGRATPQNLPGTYNDTINSISDIKIDEWKRQSTVGIQTKDPDWPVYRLNRHNVLHVLSSILKHILGRYGVNMSKHKICKV